MLVCSSAALCVPHMMLPKSPMNASHSLKWNRLTDASWQTFDMAYPNAPSKHSTSPRARLLPAMDSLDYMYGLDFNAPAGPSFRDVVTSAVIRHAIPPRHTTTDASFLRGNGVLRKIRPRMITQGIVKQSST